MEIGFSELIYGLMDIEYKKMINKFLKQKWNIILQFQIISGIVNVIIFIILIILSLFLAKKVVIPFVVFLNISTIVSIFFFIISLIIIKKDFY